MSIFHRNDQLDGIMNDLTGQTIEDSEDDNAGTYFDREHWVSAHKIAEALIEAYELGQEEA